MWKIKLKLLLLGWFRIPMIGFVRPRLISLSEESVELKIPLTRRTKNHLNSMYFGALCVGADLAAGLHVLYFSEKQGCKVSFAFKEVQGNFVQRAESSVRFRSESGVRINELLTVARQTKQRQSESVRVSCLNELGETVAEFTLVASVKVIG